MGKNVSVGYDAFITAIKKSVENEEEGYTGPDEFSELTCVLINFTESLTGIPRTTIHDDLCAALQSQIDLDNEEEVFMRGIHDHINHLEENPPND